MSMVLDHTIIPVQDQDRAMRFYTSILGLRDGGRVGHFAVVYVNDSLTLDFRAEQEIQSRHFAFAMDAEEFETVFQRDRKSTRLNSSHSRASRMPSSA